MTLGQLIQTMRDSEVMNPKIQKAEWGVLRTLVNVGLRHVCTTMRIPSFCFRGELQALRTVYKYDFNISDVTAVRVHHDKKDYPLDRIDIDMIRTAYAKYNQAALAPEDTFVAENEATSPSGIKYYGLEVRAPSARDPEGALLVWIRPASNTNVTNGLWVFGVYNLPALTQESQNIPIPEVYQLLGVYWALWLATKDKTWLTTYYETLPTVVNFAPNVSGDMPVPRRGY